jgi:hypothetical protein
MGGSISRRILGSLLLIAGAVTTAYKWVLFLAGGPLVYPRIGRIGRSPDGRDFGLFLGPFILVLGIGLCFLRPWEEAEQARSRGEWIGRLPVPPHWLAVVSLALCVAVANAVIMLVLFLAR